MFIILLDMDKSDDGLSSDASDGKPGAIGSRTNSHVLRKLLEAPNDAEYMKACPQGSTGSNGQADGLGGGLESRQSPSSVSTSSNGSKSVPSDHNILKVRYGFLCNMLEGVLVAGSGGFAGCVYDNFVRVDSTPKRQICDHRLGAGVISTCGVLLLGRGGIVEFWVVLLVWRCVYLGERCDNSAHYRLFIC